MPQITSISTTNGHVEVMTSIKGTWLVRMPDGKEYDVYEYRAGLSCPTCRRREEFPCEHISLVKQLFTKEE